MYLYFFKDLYDLIPSGFVMRGQKVTDQPWLNDIPSSENNWIPLGLKFDHIVLKINQYKIL